MNLKLRIWRQKNADDRGGMVSYQVEEISPDMSFLEMLDTLNEKLTVEGEDPVLHKEALDFEYVHPTQRSYA